MKLDHMAQEYLAYAETVRRLSEFKNDSVVAILSAVVADVLLQLTSDNRDGTKSEDSATKFYNGTFKKSVISAYPVINKMHDLYLMEEARHETKQ